MEGEGGFKTTYPTPARPFIRRCVKCVVCLKKIERSMCVGKIVVQELNIQDALVPQAYMKTGSSEVQYTEDVLATFTVYTKAVLFGLGDVLKQLRQSPFYKILFHTTQPAHLIVALAVSTVAYLFLSNKEHTVSSPLWTFVYLVAVSTHFGAQIWMTFVSGLSLYFSLPRHTFGSVQKVLFPMYFLINSVLSFITLALFIRHNNSSLYTLKIIVQTATLSLCFLAELLIRLYLAPPLIVLIDQKNTIEKDAGVGMEVGKHNPGKLVNCPHYLRIHRAFRKTHMCVAIGNIFTLACTVIHLHYLAHKICVL